MKEIKDVLKTRRAETPADIFEGKALWEQFIVRFRFGDVASYLAEHGLIMRQSEVAKALEEMGARRMGNTVIATKQIRPWAVTVEAINAD